MKKLLAFKSLILISSLALITGCSTKQEPKQKEVKQEKVEKTITTTGNDNFMNQYSETNKLLKRHFAPWDQNKLSYTKKEASWGFRYKEKTMYLENHKKAPKQWFEKQIQNANFAFYNSDRRKAITLKNTNVRVLPTLSPMFYKPSRPGEGFPFDYNQNSAIKINTPLMVSHFSKDKAWAYIQTSSVGGWVNINDIAFVDSNFIQNFRTNDYYVAIKEKFPLYDNVFREYVKVATIFPKSNGKYLIAKADFNHNAVISYINIKDDEVDSFPLKYNSENRIKIAKQLLDEPYGWGGLLNNRDCSSFTKDFFAPFGKFLERNSKGQTKNGRYLDVSYMSKRQKKEYIKQHGVPFSTLVYLKGHIMLYIGVKNDEPMVMHNMWSVRLKTPQGKKYRHIVGKATITTLEPGKDLKDFDENNNMLNQVRGIVIL